MDFSADVQDVILVQSAGKHVPIIISDVAKSDAQRAAKALRQQGHVVMSGREAAEAGILPAA